MRFENGGGVIQLYQIQQDNLKLIKYLSEAGLQKEGDHWRGKFTWEGRKKKRKEHTTNKLLIAKYEVRKSKCICMNTRLRRTKTKVWQSLSAFVQEEPVCSLSTGQEGPTEGGSPKDYNWEGGGGGS